MQRRKARTRRRFLLARGPRPAPSRRVAGHDQPWAAGELAGDDDTLLVAAGEAGDRQVGIARPDAVALDESHRVAEDRGAVDPAAAAVGEPVEAAQRQVDGNALAAHEPDL